MMDERKRDILNALMAKVFDFEFRGFPKLAAHYDKKIKQVGKLSEKEIKRWYKEYVIGEGK